MNPEPYSPWRFCVAPMMDWTDRRCRFLHRQLSRRARLYTEMVTAAAVIHGPRERLLGFDPAEQPVAMQLGGSDPAALAQAAIIAEDFGYSEINLNVGCPSDRVQGGNFGACLMAEPELVGDCVSAMKAVVSVPVTVKCRIGIDEQDPEEALAVLVAAIVSADVDAVIVHARKAWLKGLSPKENREIPPLDYDRVYRLKRQYPALPVVINGGIAAVAATHAHLAVLDGVMLGRTAYQHPDMLLAVDPELFCMEPPHRSVDEVVEVMAGYAGRHVAGGGRLSDVTRHMLGLYGGQPGARAFRRHLATEAVKPGADADVIRTAMRSVHTRPSGSDLAA